jgi:hypothetical protein
MTLKTKNFLSILLLIWGAYEYRNVRKLKMSNEENKNENEKRKETTEKVLNNKLEKLRRWFESIGDCV